MAVALEGILGVLVVQLMPLANQVQVQFVLTSGLGYGFTRLDFTQDLLLELFGENAAL